MLLILILTVLQSTTKLNAIDSNSYFVNNATLIAPDNYLLYWNFTKTDITFKIVAKSTNGWIGFGISPNGAMESSDIIIAYKLSNGTVSFTDRHTDSASKSLIMDKQQNWNLLSYSEMNGLTTIIFTRKIEICNLGASDDFFIDIVPGTQYIIYAWGNLGPNGEILYHSSLNRSSTSLPLISSLNRNIVLNMSQIETFDFTVNVIQNRFFKN